MKQTSFFSNSDGSVGLRVAQVPRSSKLEILVPTMMTTTDIQTDCFTPCACVWDNKGMKRLHMDMVHTTAWSIKRNGRSLETRRYVSVCVHTKGTPVMHTIAGNIGGN